jgi:hypothetical protein
MFLSVTVFYVIAVAKLCVLYAGFRGFGFRGSAFGGRTLPGEQPHLSSCSQNSTVSVPECTARRHCAPAIARRYSRIEKNRLVRATIASRIAVGAP